MQDRSKDSNASPCRWHKHHRYLLLVAIVVLLAHTGSGGAVAKRATKEECVEFVGKAVAYFRSEGGQKALAEFSDPKGQFIDRDLYVVAYNVKGVTLAHGHIPSLVGKNRLDEQDADGVFYNRKRVALAETDANYWLFYRFSDPISHKLLRKASYCETADDPSSGTVIICSGTYDDPTASRK